MIMLKNIKFVDEFDHVKFTFSVEELYGNPVFSIYDSDSSDFIVQKNISISKGNIYQITLTDAFLSSGYTLTFGTEPDNLDSVINPNLVSYSENKTILNLQSYTDDTPIYYFSTTQSNMGYIPPSYSNTFTTMSKIFENSVDPTYYWDFRLTENISHTEDIINSSLQAVSVNGATFTEEGILLNSTEEQYLQMDPFSFGGQCSLELFFNATSSVKWNRILDFGNGNGQLSIVISSNKSNNNTLGLYLFDGTNIEDIEGSSLNNDVWYHLVITFDADEKLRIYLNNVEENIGATNFLLPNVERTFNFLGKDTFDHNDKYFHGTIAFLRIWQDHTLSTSEINSLYENRDVKYEILNSIVYDVTVTSEGVFSLSGTPQFEVSFISGYTYIFKQSDSSNNGNQIVFGRTPDDDTTLFTEGVTIMGTPGQPEAYTQIVLSDGFTGDLYYFSFIEYNLPPPIEYLVRKNTTNTTYEMSTDGGSTWTEKFLITFEANQAYKFDQSNSTNSGEQIVFGTTFDNKANVLGAADGVTIVGQPGTSGANTQLILGASFSGNLYYYSAGSNDMGFKVLPPPPYLFDSNISTTPRTISQTLDFSSDFTLEINFTPYSLITTENTYYQLFSNGLTSNDTNWLHIFVGKNRYMDQQIVIYNYKYEGIIVNQIYPVINGNNIVIYRRTGTNVSLIFNYVEIENPILNNSRHQTGDFTSSQWRVGDTTMNGKISSIKINNNVYLS
jgi:hypothetical protein